MNKITLPKSVVWFSREICHQAFRNEKRLLFSHTCACYQCCSFFNKDEIISWCDEDGKGARTALCPRCGIDSVMDDNQVPGLNPALVKLTNLVMFGDNEITKEDLCYTDPQTGEKVFFDVIDHGDHFEIVEHE